MEKVNIKFEKNTPFGEYFTYKKFVSASQTIHLDYVNDTFRLQNNMFMNSKLSGC